MPFTYVETTTVPRHLGAQPSTATHCFSGALDTAEKLLAALTSGHAYGLYGIVPHNPVVRVRAWVKSRKRKGRRRCFWTNLGTPALDVVL